MALYNTAILTSDNELCHFGILGMKWGVRRYQNKDGSLTKAGKKRYDSEIEDTNDTDYTIRKGTKSYRIANANETLDEKRKYVSVTESDKKEYDEIAQLGKLGYDKSKEYGLYTYEFSKDIRIKKGEKVVNDIVEKYGDTSVKEANEYLQKARSKFKDRESFNDYIENGWDSDNYDEWSKTDSSYDKVRNFLYDRMSDSADAITSKFKEEGYDAIIDPYDFVAGVSDYPVILLDPRNSVDRKDYDRYN